jgi:alcohol dehydrogenase (cytochrome c)
VLAGLLVAGLAVAIAGRFLSPDIAWRLDVLAAKLRGELPTIPLRQLVGWLRPGSPVYLAELAANPNPHASIRNLLTQPEDVERGRDLYVKQCGSCHGDNGRGNSAPALLEPVSVKSDWTFFSAVKWGIAGTGMPAVAINDAQIWSVHAFLRSEALAAAGPADGHKGKAARAQVEVEPKQILDTDTNPGQWLTYAGNYEGHRHSLLTQINKGNVHRLQLAWVAQLRQVDRELQASPLVANGVMYVTESREGVVALDARTGELLWTFRRPVPDGLSLCCGMPNRGVAVLGKTVFVTTIDNYLIALDASTGKQRFSVQVADHRDGYTMTGAPLALPDRIVIGVAGGEFGIRGFLSAHDPADGKLLWKFDTVPGPGEFGNDTWAGDSWKTGGAPTWVTGAYDPAQNLVIWGVGNPGPVFQADARRGDNLFSNCVIALDAQSGKLKWYFQFTPSDDHDWDSNQQPIIADIAWQGRSRPVLLWANRNGFFYALDRTSGEFLFAKPFAKQTWNEGFDEKGRPRMAASARPTPQGTVVWPAIMAATNWWPPSYDRERQLVFVPSSDAAGIFFRTDRVQFERGERFEGSAASFYSPNLPTTASVKAIDAQTGEMRWQAVLETQTENFVWTVGGVLSTRGGVAFAGYRDYFRAIDSDTGKELWKTNLGGRVRGSPISYLLDGRQYITVPAGHNVFTFVAPPP